MSQVRKLPITLVLSAAGLLAWGSLESGDASKPKLTAYDDGVGIQTICHGHTKGVTKGMQATPAQCQVWLKEDSGYAGKIVGQWVTEPVTQDQYDALVLFVGNMGPGKPGVKDGLIWLKKRDKQGKPRHSTLLLKVNAGDCQGAGKEFLKWDKAGGKRLHGLTKRRTIESSLWLKGCEA